MAWANESWSRSWLGDGFGQILVEQRYSDRDDVAHIQWLAEAFADPRYIRIHGRPLLVVYKPKALPDPRRTTDTFRSECTRLGLPEPYLVGIDAHCYGTDLRDFGFDMTEHHEPQLGVLAPDVFTDAPLRSKFRRNFKKGILSSTFKIYSYAEATRLMAQVRPKFPHFPCCFVGWDNTARRGRDAIVMVDSTPELFRGQLSTMAGSVLHKHHRGARCLHQCLERVGRGNVPRARHEMGPRVSGSRLVGTQRAWRSAGSACGEAPEKQAERLTHGKTCCVRMRRAV